jgi:hypothetical protein
MRIFHLFLAMVLAGSAAGADGAVSYTIQVTRGAQKLAGNGVSVTADHGRIRANFPEPAPDTPILHDSLLRTGGSPVIALNSQNQTWYELEPAAPFAMHSLVFGVSFEKPAVKNVTLQFEETAGTTPPEHHYSGHLAYDVHGSVFGEAVKVHCVATFEVSTTESVERDTWLGRILPVTRYPSIDEKLADADAAIKGFPTRSLLTVSRQYAGGAPMTDFTQVEVLDLHQTEGVDASLFERPPAYRHQKPVVAAPGS